MKKAFLLNILLAIILLVPSTLLTACGYNPEDDHIHNYYLNDEGASVQASYTENYWNRYNPNLKPEDRRHNVAVMSTNGYKHAAHPDEIIGPKYTVKDEAGNETLVQKNFGGWYSNKECTPDKLITEDYWTTLTNEDKEHLNFYAKWLEPNEIYFVVHSKDKSKYYSEIINSKFSDAFLTANNNLIAPIFKATKENLKTDLTKLPKANDFTHNPEYQFEGWYLDEGEFIHHDEYALQEDLVLNKLTSKIAYIDLYPKFTEIPKVYLTIFADAKWRTNNENMLFTKEFAGKDFERSKSERLLSTDTNASAEKLFAKLPTAEQMNETNITNVISQATFDTLKYNKLKPHFLGWYFVDEVEETNGKLHLIENPVKVTLEEIQNRITKAENNVYLNIGALWDFEIPSVIYDINAPTQQSWAGDAKFTKEFLDQFHFNDVGYEQFSQVAIYATDEVKHLPEAKDMVGQQYNKNGQQVSKTFAGWFFDKQCTKAVTQEFLENIGTRPETTTTLYAKWVEA